MARRSRGMRSRLQCRAGGTASRRRLSAWQDDPHRKRSPVPRVAPRSPLLSDSCSPRGTRDAPVSVRSRVRARSPGGMPQLCIEPRRPCGIATPLQARIRIRESRIDERTPNRGSRILVHSTNDRKTPAIPEQGSLVDARIRRRSGVVRGRFRKWEGLGTDFQTAYRSRREREREEFAIVRAAAPTQLNEKAPAFFAESDTFPHHHRPVRPDLRAFFDRLSLGFRSNPIPHAARGHDGASARDGGTLPQTYLWTKVELRRPLPCP